MKLKRRIKITSETERNFSVSLNRKPIRFFCASCDEQSEMISINEAAKLLKTAWREIVGSIESGKLHSTETDAGEIYVCAVSISNKNNF